MGSIVESSDSGHTGVATTSTSAIQPQRTSGKAKHQHNDSTVGPCSTQDSPSSKGVGTSKQSSRKLTKQRAALKRKADGDSFDSADGDSSDEANSPEADYRGKGKGKAHAKPKRKTKTVDEHGDVLVTSTRVGSNSSPASKRTDVGATSSACHAPLISKAARAKLKARPNKLSSESDAPLISQKPRTSSSPRLQRRLCRQPTLTRP